VNPRVRSFLRSVLQDIRYSARAVARSKSTTLVLLISLALGTGANAAVYGVVEALLLGGPAGVADSSDLLSIYTSEYSGAPYGRSSFPDFESVVSQAGFLASAAAVDDNAVENVRFGESAYSARIASVSAAFFDTLQMRPHLGRFLTSEDATSDPGGAVVSLALAQQLADDALVVGKTLSIRDHRYAIVGVAPERFRGLDLARECDVWIPMASQHTARGNRRLSIVARVRDGTSLEEARVGLGRISDDLAAKFPRTNSGSINQTDAPRRILAVRFSQLDPGANTRVVLIGMVIGGAALLLLASACLNVGSLLLSRAVARKREFAVKMALGATRRRLFRQLLTEAVCLSLMGGALGLLFAIWTGGAIPALFIADQAQRLDTGLDAPAFLLTVGLAGLAGAVFGVAPAFHGTGLPAVTALRADAGGVSEQQGGVRARALLIGAQLAVSTVLLLATGALVTALSHALEGDRASAAKKIAFVSIELPGRWADPVRGVAYRNAALDRYAELDGVEAAAWASTLPLGRGNRRQFRIEGDATDVTDTVELDTNVVSAGYFRALALPSIEGRLFDDGDHARSAPVVIVDEVLARRYFGRNAVGRVLVDAQGESATVVGVVRSGVYRTLQQAPQPTVYYPVTQDYLWRGYFILRTVGDPEAVRVGLNDVLAQMGPADVLKTSTLDAHLSDVLAVDRLTTTLVGLCGLIALAMSTIGVYGVMSDAVIRRTREIGLRVALGASGSRVARLIFMEAGRLAIAGVAAGIAAAIIIGYLARTYVDGLPALDPLTLAAAAGALAIVVPVAGILPLRRALRVNPNVALRAE
jgi:putative ABC transport system permease protein